MNLCCPHSEAEHHLLATCQEVIHYPSEDYPCLCTGYAPSERDGECERCSHRRESHGTARVCRPHGGEVCGCQRTA